MKPKFKSGHITKENLSFPTQFVYYIIKISNKFYYLWDFETEFNAGSNYHNRMPISLINKNDVLYTDIFEEPSRKSNR